MAWSEQDHHLSGALGAALAARLFELRWVARLPRTRAVRLTDDGAERRFLERQRLAAAERRSPG